MDVSSPNSSVSSRSPEQGGSPVSERPLYPAAPYLEGNYAPTFVEDSGSPLKVIEGEFPIDLRGVFVRNGANLKYRPEGRHHWFDGDGMLHAVHIENGQAIHRNRWVRTAAYLAEEAEGKSLWKGVTERPDFTNPRGPLKDTSNTDVVFHNGKLLTTWYLSGKPYAVDPLNLETEGPARFGSFKKISAHPKVDPVTGEMVIFDYNPLPPYFTMGVLSKSGELIHSAEIPYEGPRLQHDIAITRNHTIVMDLSMMWDPDLLKKGVTRVGFFRDKPTRFGVIPRFGKGDAIKWFETPACFMYHTINAWEEGDEIVMMGCRIDNPLAFDPHNPKAIAKVPTIGFLRLEPYLCRWRMNLRTGQIRSELLDDVPTEFPRMDNRVLGRKSRYSYNPRLAPLDTLLFDGFVRYDFETGQSLTYNYPKGCYGGELVFCAREGSEGARDIDDADGYLMTYVVNEATGRSELQIFDAHAIDEGPITRAEVRDRVPTGFHAWWVDGKDLEGASL